MTESIGDRRTFFPEMAWRLPDPLLVIAGPFSECRVWLMASRRQPSGSRISLTKRLSKHSLLKQRRAGYGPPAWTRKLDRPNGPAERSVSIEQLRNRQRSDSRQRSAVGRKGPPRARRPIAGAGDRKGSGRRSEIDPPHGWGQPKSPPRFRGRASPATAATGGLLTGWHSSLVTGARKTPPVAADYRQPATPCPHHTGPTACATAERNDTTATCRGRVRSTLHSRPVLTCEWSEPRIIPLT